MLWTMGSILLVLWVLGMVSGGTVGAWVHLLLLFGLTSVMLGVVNSARRRRL
jgi:hypothetical protein